MTAIGFIGLGLMGREIAANLCHNQHDVTVWNRSGEACAPLVALGAKTAASPAEIGASCGLIFVCVSDGSAVRHVLLGADGVSMGASTGTLVVDHSTVAPEDALAIAADLAATCGARFIDAPVTGGTPGAKARQLVMFAGGNEADVRIAEPCMRASAQRVEHMGGVGTGQATKMCNQMLALNTFAVVAETIKLAEALGLDAERLPAVVAGGSADSRVLQMAGTPAAQRSDELTASISIQAKDLELLLGVGRDAGVTMPMTAAAAQVARLAKMRGMGGMDASQLIRLYDQSHGSMPSL
ncbi:MAG: NAD-binding protein [Gammaproteobacteria bacterium]|nr:NAD-binding protein [Gammaproteobacteria bacterium]